MAFLGKSAFAKEAGVSRQRIYKMCDDGHLTVRPDGKLDTEDPTNRNYLKSKVRPDGLKDSDRKKPEKKPEDKNITINLPKKSGKSKTGKQSVEASEEMDKYVLQCKKLAADTKRVNVITDERRKDLIPKETMTIILSRLHSIDSKELLQLPAKLSPEITALTGNDDPTMQIEIERVLEQELYNIIDRSKAMIMKELKKYKTQLIENQESIA